jgi:plasmid stabilization system protein ParE
MSRYNVEFSEIAESELVESILWGIDFWGEEAAFRWVREFKRKAQNQLARFPLAQPFAPESELVDGEVRQLIIGRYRILFEIVDKTVNILHIKGPFSVGG